MVEPPSAQSSIAKAAALLEAFRGPDMVLGVSELARRSGLWKSTAHRVLTELESVGFVEREGAGYRLGMQLFELGVRVGDYRPGGLRDLAIGELSRLHVRTGLTANLAVLEGSEVVYLERLHAREHKVTQPVTSPGVRLPATCSALGKAILSVSPPAVVGEVLAGDLPRRTGYSITEPGRFLRELQKTQAEGVARETEEMVMGASQVAAPVLSHAVPVAAISLSGRALGINWELAAREVKAAAERISASLSGRPPGG